MRAKWVIVIVAVCAVVTVAAIAYAAGKTSAPEVIRAQKFQLVDSEGRVLGELVATGQGGSLVLSGNDGFPLAMLGVGGIPGTGAGSGTGLALVDEQGKMRVLAGVFGQGSAAMLLEEDPLDPSRPGQEKMHLGMLDGMVDGDVVRGIFIADEEQKMRASLALLDGSPLLSICDEKGTDRAVLGTTDLVTTRTGAETKTAESSLVLFDKDGKVLWEAP